MFLDHRLSEPESKCSVRFSIYARMYVRKAITVDTNIRFTSIILNHSRSFWGLIVYKEGEREANALLNLDKWGFHVELSDFL